MLQIRCIQPGDDPEMGQLIRSVLLEFNVPKVGTAYADPSLDAMYQFYQSPKSRYYVLTDGQTIFGGAGIAPLANFHSNYCELQKMYFSKQARSKGYGRQMMDLCLKYAVAEKFDFCYIETMDYMKRAQTLYLRSGFDYIDGPLGDTGHHACGIQMLKTISQL